MQENGKISIRQFAVLVFIFTLGSSVLIAPSLITTAAKNDAWIAAILGVTGGVVLVWLYNTLGKRYPNKTLTEYSETILGTWAGKTVSLLFIVYFFLLTTLLLREIGDFITTQMMPETPLPVILILFTFIIVMGTHLGLQVIARASEVFFPWVILLTLLLVFLLLPQTEFSRVQPIMAEGIKPVLHGALQLLSLSFLELFIFLMIIPDVNRQQEAGKGFWQGTVLGGILLIFLIIMCILTLGASLTMRQIYPSYILAKKINLFHFLERLEVMMATIWFITLYFKIAICFYGTLSGLAQIIKLRDYRVLTIPFAMILIVLSIIISPNILYFQKFIETTWISYSLATGLFLPGLLLGVDVIKNKTQSPK